MPQTNAFTWAMVSGYHQTHLDKSTCVFWKSGKNETFTNKQFAELLTITVGVAEHYTRIDSTAFFDFFLVMIQSYVMFDSVLL
jgi:hypothetical protein